MLFKHNKEKQRDEQRQYDDRIDRILIGLETALKEYTTVRKEMADAGKISVQYLNIMAEMEKYNAKMREIAIAGSTEEKIAAYDIGVKNTMSNLEMLLDTLRGTPLIYDKKDADTPDVVRYTNLSTVIMELSKTKQEET